MNQEVPKTSFQSTPPKRTIKYFVFFMPGMWTAFSPSEAGRFGLGGWSGTTSSSSMLGGWGIGGAG